MTVKVKLPSKFEIRLFKEVLRAQLWLISTLYLVGLPGGHPSTGKIVRALDRVRLPGVSQCKSSFVHVILHISLVILVYVINS